MAQQPINVIRDAMSAEGLSEELAKLQKTLRWMLNGNIDFENIRAKGIVADNIAANTITADKMDVSELSAIAANLGHITAGLIEAVNIIGSYIATSNGTYPRCEMSSTGNLFSAYSSEDTYIHIDPYFYLTNKPAIVFNDGDLSVGTISADDKLNLNGLFGLNLTAGAGPITLSTNGVQGVRFVDWSDIRNMDTGSDLQTDLNDKADSGASTGSAGGHNHAIPAGTRLAVVDASNNIIGHYIWSVAASHTHTQS
ncbi:hypothetical protein [Paenibacillus sp. YIM B09110]|uniref:hypothetical protein n=1 Tax=Paenibacillus sp. YIM B09110 TaxID=3126102 RepID=UPI00301D5F3A